MAPRADSSPVGAAELFAFLRVQLARRAAASSPLTPPTPAALHPTFTPQPGPPLPPPQRLTGLPSTCEHLGTPGDKGKAAGTRWLRPFSPHGPCLSFPVALCGMSSGTASWDGGGARGL